MDSMNFQEQISAQMVRKRSIEDILDIKGFYPIIEHWRDGEKIGEYSLENGVTNVGKDYILNAGFNSGTQVATASWVIGLIDNASYTALAAADTMASHTGWIEFTGYNQANRVAWGQANSSGQSVTNGTPATFDLTANGTLVGIFIVSQNTKGGTTGTLWSTGTFSSTVPVSTGDQFKITYAIAC